MMPVNRIFLGFIVSAIVLVLAIQIFSMHSVTRLTVQSTAFADTEFIPAEFTCDGASTSPDLSVSGIPASAKTLALILSDPDAPSGTFYHWVVFDIPVSEPIFRLGAGKEPAGQAGAGSSGQTSYAPPCPPSGTHRYIFSAYALDAELNLPNGTPAEKLIAAMKGHILAEGRLLGFYSRIK